MKAIFSKLFIFAAFFVAVFSTITPLTASAVQAPAADDNNAGSAIGSCRELFLGITSWDCSISEDWSIKDRNNDREISPEENYSLQNIVKIAKNVSNNITVVAGYLAFGFIIYGGFLYMFSDGDPGKAASGKKTLINALIGLSFLILAHVILNTIHIAIMGTNGEFGNDACVFGECANPEELIGHATNWVYGITGAVALVFVVLGGISYITSAGDPGKLQKAKTTIMYSLIGLAIVGLAAAITNLVINIVGNAADSSNSLNTVVVNIVFTVIGLLGIVATTYVVIGGFQYMSAAGDAGKLQKAKTTILYAAIGLVVCALAAAIVNFAIAAIG